MQFTLAAVPVNRILKVVMAGRLAATWLPLPISDCPQAGYNVTLDP